MFLMKTSDFDYHLPESSIAQIPVEPRVSSRLLVLHRDTGDLEHKIFRDVKDYLITGDLLVLNQTRVIPARIFAGKETGGRVELLLGAGHGWGGKEIQRSFSQTLEFFGEKLKHN